MTERPAALERGTWTISWPTWQKKSWQPCAIIYLNFYSNTTEFFGMGGEGRVYNHSTLVWIGTCFLNRCNSYGISVDPCYLLVPSLHVLTFCPHHQNMSIIIIIIIVYFPWWQGSSSLFSGELYWFVWFWVVLVLLLLRFLLCCWAGPWGFGCWLLLSWVCLGCRRIFLCCIPCTHLLYAGLHSPPGHAFGSPPVRRMLCRYGSGICFCSCFSLAAFLFWLWR